MTKFTTHLNFKFTLPYLIVGEGALDFFSFVSKVVVEHTKIWYYLCIEIYLVHMYIFRFITLDCSLNKPIIGFYVHRFVTYVGILLYLMLYNGLDFWFCWKVGWKPLSNKAVVKKLFFFNFFFDNEFNEQPELGPIC